MTCIVGLTENGVTWIGGDSLGSNGYSGTIYKQPKVFHSKDSSEVVMGYTGTFRMGQLLGYAKGLFDELSLSKNEINHEYMVSDFVPNLQALFSSGGVEKNEKGEKTCGTFLLGYKGNLFEVQSDYSVLESSDNYSSCGSGDSFALGSLKTTEGMDMTPAERIHKALQSANKFSISVSPPFSIINTKTKEVMTFNE